MKKAGRVLVGLIAASMAMGSVASVSAAIGEVNATGQSGSLKGTGALEGNVNTKVVKVVLPTNSLNFTIDPVGLIKATNGAKLINKDKKIQSVTFKSNGSDPAESFDGSGVFFTTITENEDKTGKYVTLDNVAKLEVTNKSSVDVKITPTIGIAGTQKLEISTDKDLSGADKPLIYMGMTYTYEKPGAPKTVTNPSTPTVAKAAKTSADAAVAAPFNLSGAPDNYEKVFVNGKYSYQLKAVPEDEEQAAAFNDKFMTAKFSIEALCSSGDIAAWSTVTDKPTLEVTWKIEDPTT